MRNSWVICSLGSITSLIKDGTHGTHKDVQNGIPLLSAKDIYEGNILIPNDCRNISQKDFDQIHKNYKLQKGDLLITLVGTIGRTAIVNDYNNTYTFQRSVGIIRLNDSINNLYGYYFISSEKFKNDLIRSMNASAQGGVYLGELAKLNIKYPPLPQQKKIAQILTTCDTVIEKTEATIAKYQAVKQGLMHDLFTRGIDIKTGKLRPKQEDAPELYKESELGWIPMEWEVKSLGGCGVFRKGFNIPKYLLSNEGIGCILYGQLYTRFNNVIEKIESSIPKKFAVGMSYLKFGDILFAGSGETHEEIGKSAVLLSNKNVLAGGDIVILSLNENHFAPFFGYFLNFTPIQRQKSRLGQGSSVIHIYASHLQSINLKLPNRKEQEFIYKQIYSIDNKLQTEQSYLSKYQKLKTGLMQDLLTGKVEVKA